ncbi:MAG: hypothetical protein NTV46_08785 [Verrucomicrobia bacterium]|nr:hypothetical protein [Verrucomicrobiota bacterium]
MAIAIITIPRDPMKWLLAMISACMLGLPVADARELPLTIEVRSDDLVDVAVSFDPKESSQPATLTNEAGDVRIYTCPLPESFSIESSRVKIEAVHKLPGGGQQYRQSCEVDRQYLKSRVLRLQGHPGRILLEDLTSKVKAVHLQLTGDNGVTLVGSTQRIQLSNLVMHCELPTGKYGIAQYRCKLYVEKPMDPDELDRCIVTISAARDLGEPMGDETYQYLIPRHGKVSNLVVKLFSGSIVLPFPAEGDSELFYVIRKGSNEYASDIAPKVLPDGRLVHWNLPAGRYELSVFDPMRKDASRKWDLVLADEGDEIQVLRNNSATGPTIHQAEQVGADQPATKPADKPPVKNQPSTPTSKDGPR